MPELLRGDGQKAMHRLHSGNDNGNGNGSGGEGAK
jgi:hypothetical protein